MVLKGFKSLLHAILLAFFKSPEFSEKVYNTGLVINDFPFNLDQKSLTYSKM